MMYQKGKILKFKFLALLIFLSCGFSCSSQSETLYIKRDNSVFADGIIYEFLFSIQEDSFKILGYHERSSNAVIESGPVFIKEDNSLSLVVENTQYVSLRTGQEKKVNLPKEDVRYWIKPIDDYYEYDIHKYSNNILNESFYEYPFNSLDSLSKLEQWLLSDMTDTVPAYNKGVTLEIKGIQKTLNPPPPPPKTDSAQKDEEERLESLRKENIETLASEIAASCSITSEEKVVLQININPSGNILSYELPRRESMNTEKADCIDQIMKDNTTNLGELKVLSTARSKGRLTDILYTMIVKQYDK